MSALVFRAPCVDDAAALTGIHRDGLATGHASFRETPYIWSDFVQSYGRGDDWQALVAEQDGRVLAWAGVVSLSDRCVYAGVGEVSAYVAKCTQGRGVGRACLQALVDLSEQQGFWTLTAQVFPENPASLALHEACGFRVLGQRQRIGRMAYGPHAGQWRDTVAMERRSAVVGVD